MVKKDNRIKYNLLSGFLYQIVLLAVAFLLPRLYIDKFGSEVNGILNTIKQIFTYMCLLEAGIGLAATQALYKPVAENDHKKSSSIISATGNFYFKTGVIYSVIVLIIAFVFSFYARKSLDFHIIFSLIILNAMPSLFSYFLEAKYRVLMSVDGRRYIITNSETMLQLLSNAGKILVLFLTDSLVLIQLVYCVLAVLQILYIYIRARLIYKWLDKKAEPDFQAISQRKSVLVHQISGMVFSNTDMLLLSAMCGFETVSVYAIYNMFFTQVQNFITIITSGFSFALGQMFQTDREKFIKRYNIYETFYIMCTFIIYTLMAVFLLPLIEIYTKGVDDVNYSIALLVFLFVIMNLLSNGKLPSNHVLEYSGKFEETRSHAVVEMIINIGVSVVAIHIWGICGAVTGTIVALLYRGTMMIYYANRKVLERSMFNTYKHWIVNGAVFAFIMAVFFVDSYSGYSFINLLFKGIIHSVWIVPLYFVINFIFFKDEFKGFFKLLGSDDK